MNENVVELTNQALSLPVAERVELAQRLWESLPEIDGGDPPEEVAEALKLARQRDSEMERGNVQGIPHEQVMQNARHALGCD
jgi:putative addiction module component (TIGR02574 family)